MKFSCLQRRRGFTLVELAIVMTIIGLLIGGILKGQELLNNSRMISIAVMVKNTSAAGTTFKDVYNAVPGDMLTASARIEDCSTAPCNIPGNGDGNLGGAFNVDMYVQNDENANFFLHMAKARLLSGINPNTTWTQWYQPDFYKFPLGGKMTAMQWTINNNAWYPNNANGIYFRIDSPLLTSAAVPINAIGKLDMKNDDGRPWTGEYIMANSPCGVAEVGSGATSYNPSNTTLCNFFIKVNM